MKAEKIKIEDLIKITNSIEGWLSVQEGVFLYKLACELPDNANLVEIGSWKGKSTVWLSGAALEKKNARVHAIDPHIGSPEKEQEYRKIDTFEEFQRNIQSVGLDSKVFPIRKSSASAAKKFDRRVDLLFIDGSHAYRAAKGDLELWIPKLKRGGWIIVHDATVLSGPWKAVRERLLFSDQFKNVGMLGSMVFGKYSPPESASDKLFNLLRNFLSYLFIISYVKLRKIPFPASWRKWASKKNYKRSIKYNSKLK